MSGVRQCEFCSHTLPRGYSVCPHCGRPGRYQNVEDAADDEERAALDDRYQEAMSASTAAGTQAQLQAFEAAAGESKAVSSRPIGFLQPLVQSDNNLYSTYYKLIESEVRLPEGTKWDVLRAVSDEALFTGFKDEIRFAALSLDGLGVAHYGDCSIAWREEMIAHRASVFEENSIMFMDHHSILIRDAHRLPKGYRATWGERAKLCVAKLYKSIDATIQPDEYSGVLIRQGATPEDDEFVEVHIWGSMSRRTIERVIVPRPRTKAERTIIKAIGEALGMAGATLEVK
ncbi:MAG TPA: hypothetical protein VFB82_19635 [Blastocatellia bacterium]|nr:hypothetical protein [Blastocatellia bacterium]